MLEPRAPTVILLEGDRAGQEFLPKASRILHPDLVRIPLEFELFA